mgnify:CR=1 FL=1
MPDLVSMNRIPVMFLSHPKHGVKLLPYFRKDVCYIEIVSLSPHITNFVMAAFTLMKAATSLPLRL